MKHSTLILLFVAVGLIFLPACASTGGNDSPDAQAEDQDSDAGKIIYDPAKPSAEAKPAKPEKSPMESAISIALPASSAADAVRAIGEAYGGNLVLMAGAEPRPVAATAFKRAELSEVATGLAAEAGLAVQETAHYYFLFPPGYEPLVDVSLAGRLSSANGQQRADVAFGYGLRLYTVFAWMGYALDRTIVADNSVADARCGELALQQVPLEAALEAVLKSARVNSFALDCTDEFVFIYNPNNSSPRDCMLNTNTLSVEDERLLDRKVNLVLPNAPTPGRPLEMQQHSSQLGSVLGSMSDQLGVTIVAESGLEELPINPAVITNVRLRTALDLVIRQWLVPNYGFQVTRDRIVIRTRQP